ncbi:MAG TPA: glycerol-3-phosphate dehydrogenase [Steroidobacteraceae bacterium]|nr:glycerol-3-phosphate dehydrogenase [Steroidobacteraceae bacterium]
MNTRDPAEFDLVVVGGGINGVGIARDAAGRGLAVLLAERGDLACATSSASSKLIHGGLRYLEQYQFRLVRESLTEREVLLAAAGHLIWPLRFVLPLQRGLRPAWLLRLGLLLYDHIGGRKRLPATRSLRRGRDVELSALREEFRRGFEYSDCWADDARLVVANAMDARARGARIEVGSAVTAARRDGGNWSVQLANRSSGQRSVRARALVNAAGPWVEAVLAASGARRRNSLRLVKGSHIVVRRLYAGPQAYTLQQSDGRVVFMIPYERDFTLIGTTDVPFDGDPEGLQASGDEIAYLCGSVSDYLPTPVTGAAVRWSYAGVRPLYDDGRQNASTVTRDYAFDLDAPAGQAPMLSVFGGKLTTYRKLAEHALAELLPVLGEADRPWTRRSVLPGGDFAGADYDAFAREQVTRHAGLPPILMQRLCRAYGTACERIIGNAVDTRGLGREIAPQLFEAELEYLKDQEWAATGEDVLWRRSKLGLCYDAQQAARVHAWFGA